MNSRIVAPALAAALLASCATASLAQGGFGGNQGGFGGQGGRRGGMRGRGGFGGPGGQFGQGGPGGGRFGMQFGQQNDHNPLVSHVYALVNRPDVQNNIHLDLKQKNALAQYQQQAQESIRQQMQQMFQNMRAQRGQGGQQGQPGQRGQQDPAQRQQMRDQMQQQRTAIQDKINSGLNDVLRPDQAQRLHELDLQWRGALSIADSKVAEEAQVTPEHRTAISTLLTEYQAKQQEARQQMFQQFRANRQAAIGGQQQPGQPNQPNQQPQGNGQNNANPFLALQRQDDADRKAAEEKALALLSADEKLRWQKAQGTLFTFRTDIQTLPQ